ncbi:MAG: GDSL-type esterase/lipase family protein [bacterium]
MNNKLNIIIIFSALLISAGFTREIKILLLGDSTVETIYLPSQSKLEILLKQKLLELYPDNTYTVINVALSGEGVGPFWKLDTRPGKTPYRGLMTNQDLPPVIAGTMQKYNGRFHSLMMKYTEFDYITVRYGHNDPKYIIHNPPEAYFKQTLLDLVDSIRTYVPNTTIILETGIYNDPAHSIYGSNTSYFDKTREAALEKKTLMADVYEEMVKETEKGNWDLRMRAGNILGTPQLDLQHMSDGKEWYSNVHPNDKGNIVYARLEAEIINAHLRGETGVLANHKIILNKSLNPYPNPFKSVLNIPLPHFNGKNLPINIYNSAGQHVIKLDSPGLNGKSSLVWTGIDKNNKHVKSGVYYYNIIDKGTKLLCKSVTFLK